MALGEALLMAPDGEAREREGARFRDVMRCGDTVPYRTS